MRRSRGLKKSESGDDGKDKRIPDAGKGCEGLGLQALGILGVLVR